MDCIKKPSRRKVIERLKTPRGEIQLQERNGHYEIIHNGIFIMATYNGPSEREMIGLALDLLTGTGDIKILIGGLGIGYTLSEALKHPDVTRIDVVEIEECIIEWNKTHFKRFNGNPLGDPRVRVYNDDFCGFLAEHTDTYNVIALDTDNGPDWVVLESNKALYKKETLYVLKQRLLPEGILSIWSATESADLRRDLKRLFGTVRLIRSGDENYIYLAY